MDGLVLVWEWLSLVTRWLHVITAIAWIGSSFYFIALDLGLWPRAHLSEGVYGEAWQVHGGGFYHIQKYLVAPSSMPEELTWFKWESYATWLSGFALLILVYYAGSELFMINHPVADLESWQAISISLAALVLGWTIYHTLCKILLGKSDSWLMIVLFLILVALSYGLTMVFSGRAAYLHLGAITATIMTANVAMVIIPNQKIVVADLIAGRKPDPIYGKIAKQRSTHNNYLTLPVLFFMLSNHYPLAFAGEWNWVIASLIFLIGALVRHYFNSLHARKGRPVWALGASAFLLLLIIWLSALGIPSAKAAEVGQVPIRNLSEELKSNQSARSMEDEDFALASEIIESHCQMCHSDEPLFDGIVMPPKGIRFDNDDLIRRYAREIYLQAGASRAMPPGNLTYMADEDRLVLRRWYEHSRDKGGWRP